MKISIATSGRFHVLDLARELDALGHDVAFYSLVPPWRTARFGLPPRCNRWLLPWVAPVYLAARAARGAAAMDAANRLLVWSLDAVASRSVGKCDVFIGMSGMFSRTAEAVRRRHGAKILIERGSRHILSQREILDALRPAGASSSVPSWGVECELADYQVADLVVVPSQHVVESFVERGFPDRGLFRNPYGVDLRHFQPTPRPDGLPTVINTGGWSLRKGCDLLPRVCAALPGATLLHVGGVADAPLPPESDRFHHVDHVDQLDLPGWYAKGHVFAIASREEGLALVQPQALACGLRLVCTSRTGGADLREYLRDPSAITVVPPDDEVALRVAIGAALDASRSDPSPRDLLGAGREQLSWAAYGRRYDERLKAL